MMKDLTWLLQLLISYCFNTTASNIIFATAFSKVIFGWRKLGLCQQFIYLKRSSSLRAFQNTELDISIC